MTNTRAMRDLALENIEDILTLLNQTSKLFMAIAKEEHKFVKRGVTSDAWYKVKEILDDPSVKAVLGANYYINGAGELMVKLP